MRGPENPDAAVAAAIAGVYGPTGFHGSAVAVWEPAYGIFLVTCAHVVNCALGRNMHAADRPEVAGLRFEFQPVAGGARHVVDQVEIVAWRPKSGEQLDGKVWNGDLALLKVTGDLPSEIGAVEMKDHRIGGEVWSWFDSGAPISMVSAKVDAYHEPWITLNTTDSSLQFQSGYSGGAVWDREQRGVVGVVVSKMEGPGRRAYAIPVAAVRSMIQEREARAEGDYGEWREQARDHFAGWARLDAGQAAEDAVVGMVGRLAAYCMRAETEPGAEDDPWRAPRFAGRMSTQLGMLVGQSCKQGAKPPLTDAEKILLLLAPYLYTAGWEAVLAASRLTGRDAELQRFRGQFIALVDKEASAVRQGKQTVARTVERWLWRKWAVSAGRNDAAIQSLLNVGVGLSTSDAFAGLDTTVRKLLKAALNPTVVRALFTMMVADPSPNSVLRTVQVPAGLVGPALRFDVVAGLVTVAQLMAVDPMQVAGVCDQMTPRGTYGTEELLELDPQWPPLLDPEGDGSVAACTLDVECRRVETEALLRAHCALLDGYAMQILRNVPTLRAMVPVRFASVKLRPALLDDGEPCYQFSDVRFTLDDDLMRELLMGDKLYGDPALAYRELFQNALDACRLREKQSEYLNKTGEAAAGRRWEGLIEFRHGFDGDREYVECEDTGIGMGREEIETLFARGGARFVTSRRYIEAREKWEQEDVRFHPNSRFGIGVFSYFMIADEIRVRTYRPRVEPDRVPEPLQVVIEGPTGRLLFSPLKGTGPSELGGTEIRLYLKPGLKLEPFTETLRRLVWYCEYQVLATYEEDVFRLDPGKLSEYAAIGGDKDSLERNPSVRTDAGAEPGVWWCTGYGAALSDGVVMGHRVYGAVVNLTGTSSPKLTVDRNRPQDPDAVDAEVDRILARNMAPLIDPSGVVLSPEWLVGFPNRRLGCADSIMRSLAAVGGRPWLVEGPVDIARVGCFREEVQALSAKEEDNPARTLAGRWWAMPSMVSLWRLRAWGMVPELGFPAIKWLEPDLPVPMALPSDAVVFGQGLEAAGSPHVPLGHVLWASRMLGRSLTEVMNRLRDIGLGVLEIPASVIDCDDEASRQDLVLLSLDGDSAAPWLADGAEVGLARIVILAHRRGVELEEITNRYRDLGISIPDRMLCSDELPAGWRDVVAAVEENFNRYRNAAVISVNELAEYPLRARTLIAAAEAAGLNRDKVWDVMRDLGFRLETPRGADTFAEADAASPLADYCMECDDWVAQGQMSYLHDLHESGISIDWLREFTRRLPSPSAGPLAPWVVDPNRLPLGAQSIDRLEEHGFDVTLLRSFTTADALVLGGLPRLSGPEIGISHVVIAALIYDKPMDQVRTRLEGLGLTLPASPAPQLESDDYQILMSDSYGAEYLSPGRVIQPSEVFNAVRRSRRSVRYVIERLKALGYEVADLDLDMDRTELGDAALLHVGGRYDDVLHRKPAVPLAYLVFIALRTGRTILDVADRLRVLGFQLPSEADLTPDTQQE